MIDFTVDFSNSGQAFLRKFQELGKGDRLPIHEAIADEAAEMTQRYLREVISPRHNTAGKLGATPTGIVAKTAERVTSSATVETATVHIPGKMWNRAFHDITITPNGPAALTIPIDADAYGKRVSELKAQGWVFFMPKKQKKPLLWASNPSGEKKPMYLLASSVHQDQDRSLLPSNQDYLLAAKRGVIRVINRDIATAA